MKKLILLLALLVVPAVSFATPAEESATLTTPISSTVSGTRVISYFRGVQEGGPFRFSIMGCTSCATATPSWIPGTETSFSVGVTNSLGPNRTNIDGHAVKIGGRSPECSVTPAQLRGFLVTAVGAGAGDPIARAAKDVVTTCLGGT